jgi:D-alanyl-D-alanine carboxypeptidase
MRLFLPTALLAAALLVPAAANADPSARDRGPSWQPRELVALVADQPQQFPAGTAFSYSNTGYVLAGMIVERATGHQLGSEVERRIIGPLGLSRTSFPVNSPFLEGPHSSGYSLDYGDDLEPVPGTLLDMTVRNPSAIWASGNLVTNADDLARFFRALLRGRLLRPALLAEMKTTVATEWPGSRYGLGLIVSDSRCGRLIGHGGTMPGYQNTMLSSEDGSRQITLMVPFSVAPESMGEAKGTLEGALMEALCA